MKFQSFRFFTTPSCFLSRTTLGCMEVGVIWPAGAREGRWGSGSHEQATVLPPLLCQQFLLPAAKKTQLPLAFDGPVGLPAICWQLI